MSRTLRAVAALSALLAALPALPAQAAEPYDATLDLSFPTVASARFGHDYHADRSGGARKHKATDIMAPKHAPAYAAVDGTICSINGIDEPMPSWGYSLSVCGDDGRRYAYLHINNDRPGTDDGQGGPEHAYAPGIRRGVRVARGQLIAYVGDSGNAESTGAHIHFEIHDDRVLDPYGDTRMDPYPSLVAARVRGDYPDGSIVAPPAPRSRVSGPDRVATAIELSKRGFDRAEAAVLAPSTAAAEAIVAGPLAAVLDGPVLTTHPDALDPRVRDELRRLGVRRVVAVALPGRLVAAVAAAGFEVEPLVGRDRFEVAAEVARRTWELQGLAGGPTPVPAEVVAPGVVGRPVADASEPTLLVSASRRRDDAVALDGAVLAGRVAVFVDGVDPRSVAAVRFVVDDGYEHTERHDPYDLAGSGDRGGARLWDTADVVGTHTLVATVTGWDGTETRLEARFEVRAVTGGPAAPAAPRRRAIVALGSHPDATRAWPDSLMASYYGAATAQPVLLVAHDRLPDATRVALVGVDEVTIIGGSAAVGDAIAAAISAGGADIRRLFGPTRYSTALAVSDALVQRGLVSPARTWAATGRNWPDAATSGPVIARSGDLLVLVDGDGTGADAETRSYVSRRADAVERVVGVGGTKAVADTALASLSLWAT